MTWHPIKPAELQKGTKFRLVGKTKVYRVTGHPRRSGDVILVPTAMGEGRMKPDQPLEYESDFA